MSVHLFKRTHHQQTEYLSRISGITIKKNKLQVGGNNVLNYAFCHCLSAVLWVNRQSSLFITTNMLATQLRGLLTVCSSLHSHLIFHIANVVALVYSVSLIISVLCCRGIENKWDENPAFYLHFFKKLWKNLIYPSTKNNKKDENNTELVLVILWLY